MQVINRGSNNTMIMTLSELATLDSPVYLFKFTSDFNQTIKYFIASDLSSYPERFNQFLITETSGTEIPTSGTITLNPTGFWSYEVYEQTSTTNLDPNQAYNTTPLERGKVLVLGDTVSYKARNTGTTSYKGYGKGQS